MENGEIDLGDLAPVEVRYKIGGKSYVLREASEAAASTWLRHRINSRIYNESGEFAGLNESADDLDALLISLCLYDSDSGENPPLAVVKSWPVRVTSVLAKKAKEISDLDTVATPETIRKEIEGLQKMLAKLEGATSPKNGQRAGMVTSVSAKS